MSKYAMTVAINDEDNRRPSSLASKMREPVKRKHAPVLRIVADIIGQHVEILQASGSTANRDAWAGCYGEVIETGADPSLVLVRVVDRGCAWVRRYVVR